VVTAGPLAPAEETLSLLLDTVAELSRVRHLDDVQRIVRTAARRIARADGATLVLRDGDHCLYADEDAVSPLWKGQRFPLEACVSGWAMLNRRPVVIEDIYADPRVPLDAYRPTFVASLVMVPIRTTSPLGAIGMYWADRHQATATEIRAAQALADSTAVALEHVRVLAELAERVELSETDPLTGIANRRAWDDAIGQAVEAGSGVCLALIDLDHFKAYNDSNGHQAGDELLRESATAWRRALRSGDLVARYGGEEFAVLMHGCDPSSAIEVAERLRRVTPAGATASIGVAAWDGVEDAARLTARADRALYAAKRSGRDRVVVAA
jgi:diguanylate cyclase (GGDEF)-like protein